MWTCPKCNREFKKENQAHSCMVKAVEDHFKGRNPLVEKLFNQIRQKIEKWENVRMHSTQNAITFLSKTTFASCNPKKDHLVVEFFLPEEHLAFPVYKTVRLSKSRVVHYVKVDAAEQVDEQLMAWLRASYNLTN